MTANTVILRHDPAIWKLLGTLAQSPSALSQQVTLIAQTDEQPPIALVHCLRIEDTTFDFLRLVLVEAGKIPPPGISAVLVPKMLVAAIAEMKHRPPAGFLAGSEQSGQ